MTGWCHYVPNLIAFFSVLEININIDWKTSMKYYLNLPNSPQYVNIYYSLVFSVSHKVSVVKTTIIILSYICQGKWKKIDSFLGYNFVCLVD
jgi:hypothetical protein